MNKAKLTKAGAVRYGVPHLTGETVEYDSVHASGIAVENVYHDGRKIGGMMGFTGDDRSLDLITEEEGTDGL